MTKKEGTARVEFDQARRNEILVHRHSSFVIRHSMTSARYKIVTFVVAILVGMIVADETVGAPGSWKNLLAAGGGAAAVAYLLAWLRARRGR